MTHFPAVFPPPFLFPARVAAKGKAVVDVTRTDANGYYPLVLKCATREQADCLAAWINAAHAALPLPALAPAAVQQGRGAL